jgi:dihydrofolate synthase/folylpolyglutamate synthase
MQARELIDWIHGAQRFGEKKGLQNIMRLLRALGNPEARLRCVHVAGTNAKGSVCALVESALRAGGFKTGLYTSPFLVAYPERIRIDGQPIGEALFEWAGNRVREAVGKMPDMKPTAFELGTALALLAFFRSDVDIAVIEVGIGGRLDPTNAITPEVSVIANIGLDHMGQLGDTIEKIAGEKAGIIKPGVPVAMYPQKEPAAERVIERACKERGAPLLRAEHLPLTLTRIHARGADFSCEAPLLGKIDARINLAGRHQVENAHLALAALSLMRGQGWEITKDAIAAGFAAARWHGRLEWAGDGLLLDGAHNPQAARALRDYIGEFLPDKKIVLLTAMMSDKQPEACARILAPCAWSVVATQVAIPRALDAQTLAQVYRAQGVAAQVVREPAAALGEAAAQAGARGVVVACGSLYLVGELMRLTAAPAGGDQ